MGEEEKKPEESKVEEKKAEEPKKEKEKKEEEKKAEEEPKDDKESKEEPAPPPEIVLQVFMHCEGCARKVRRSLHGFPGVQDIITDCKSHTVVVKGEKADPLKVLERVQRKSHRKVELLSPIPKPPAEDEKPKPEEKKEEPEVITVVLKVHMHCEACAQEIKRRIEKMKGVESAEADLKKSEVRVKGALEAGKLVEQVYKRTGKHAVIVEQEAEKKDENEEKGDKKEKGSGEGEEKKEAEGEVKAEEAEAAAATTTTEEEEGKESTVVEVKKIEYYYNAPRYGMEYPHGLAYAPQIFSDENPNACSVM